MIERPSLSNGYLWVCHAAMSASKARRIEQGLGDIRCELLLRDASELGDPQADTVVELWVHPEDDTRACDLLSRLGEGE